MSLRCLVYPHGYTIVHWYNHCSNFDLTFTAWSVSPFLLWQSQYSLNTGVLLSADLTCYHILKRSKTFDVIYMKRVPNWGHPPSDSLMANLSHGHSLHLLWQSRHSLNTDVPSSADLT